MLSIYTTAENYKKKKKNSPIFYISTGRNSCTNCTVRTNLLLHKCTDVYELKKTKY